MALVVDELFWVVALILPAWRAENGFARKETRLLVPVEYLPAVCRAGTQYESIYVYRRCEVYGAQGALGMGTGTTGSKLVKRWNI